MLGVIYSLLDLGEMEICFLQGKDLGLIWAFLPHLLVLMNLQSLKSTNPKKRFNNLRGISSPPSFFANNAPNFNFPAQTSRFNRISKSSSGLGNNLFGSQAAELTRKKVKDSNLITETKVDIDDTLYELPENTELELERTKQKILVLLLETFQMLKI